MNRKARGKIFIALGFLMVFISTAIFMTFDYQEKKAGENAAVLLEELKIQQEKFFLETENSAGEMPQQTLRGYNLVGRINFSSVGVELPVLNEWSYELLKISPCRYSGSVEDGNLIILGHNYKSHFAPLKNCSVGDAVYFTDVNGIRHTYTVSETETLYKTELDKLTASDYDLTVFTCTASGQSRLVIRCSKVK